MAVEKDTSKVFRVEIMNDDQFSGHCNNLQSPMAQLNPNTKDFSSIKRILQFGIEWRAEAADNLRHCAQTQVTAGASAGEFSDAYKAGRLVKLRLNLCKARELYLYASIAATDGWEAALEILGESFDAVMSEDQKKKLESIRKKKLGDEDKLTKPSNLPNVTNNSPEMQNALLLAQLLQAQAAASSSNVLTLAPQPQQQQPSSNLLSLTTAGGKMKRGTGKFINKTGSQCWGCQGYGHWGEDDICPLNIIARSNGLPGKRRRTDGN